MAQIVNARIDQYTAVLGQTEFIYTFQIFEDDEISVQKDNVTLDLTTDYTVSGAESKSGGIVTLNVACTGGEIITLTGNTKIIRRAVFTDSGDYSSLAINQEYNISRYTNTEIRQNFEGTLRLRVPNPAVDLGIPAPEAGKTFKWNDTADALENTVYDPDEQAELAESYADAAFTSADNAAASETAALGYRNEAEIFKDEAEAAAASIDLENVTVDIKPETIAPHNLGADVANRRWANVYADSLNALNSIILGSDNIVAIKAAQFQHKLASGVESGPLGGDTTSDVQRPINHTVYNNIGAVLSANNITLLAGKYLFYINVASYDVHYSRFTIKQITPITELYAFYSTDSHLDLAGPTIVPYQVITNGHFKLDVSTPTDYGIFMQGQQISGADNSFGADNGFVQDQIYLDLLIIKIG